MTRFVNAANGYSEVVRPFACFFLSLLFGCLFFLVKGVYRHAALSFILAFCTLGISCFVYPFFAYGIIKRSYLQRGWMEVPYRMGYTRESSGPGSYRLHRYERTKNPRDAYGRLTSRGV